MVAGVAFSNGHPHLLASPFDSTGTFCLIKDNNADTLKDIRIINMHISTKKTYPNLPVLTFVLIKN